ncbi:hypothetical protein CIG75_11925 [Tumebacillus algifaecis]|uniref:Uncharacterized protein n=1 Tax=Tumebacillus algifaecis TaxID=1214604 RepID=A0A223D2L0_9BACL|nr:hypothetical protein [Tumebacillus algifaecis]ASS75627.1 hypothetical protein CIG75_11925 [Tumebacillus algifaecis]
MKQKQSGLGLQVGLGVFGFFLAMGLSLAAGNTMLTSLIRGAIGLLGLFVLGYLLKFTTRIFVGEPEGVEARGKHIDLLLPEQPPVPMPDDEQLHEEPVTDFVPLHQTLPQQTVSDEEARKMAEALRHLKELDR